MWYFNSYRPIFLLGAASKSNDRFRITEKYGFDAWWSTVPGSAGCSIRGGWNMPLQHHLLKQKVHSKGRFLMRVMGCGRCCSVEVCSAIDVSVGFSRIPKVVPISDASCPRKSSAHVYFSVLTVLSRKQTTRGILVCRNYIQGGPKNWHTFLYSLTSYNVK